MKILKFVCQNCIFTQVCITQPPTTVAANIYPQALLSTSRLTNGNANWHDFSFSFVCKLRNFPISWRSEDNFCFLLSYFSFSLCLGSLWVCAEGRWIMWCRACGRAVSLKYSPQTYTHRDTNTHGMHVNRNMHTSKQTLWSWYCQCVQENEVMRLCVYEQQASSNNCN